MRPFLCCLMFLVVCDLHAQSAGSQFYLKDGDRIVFYGDSITDQSLYTALVETYVVTRYPNLKVTFVNSGWGGDTVNGGGGGPIDVRLKRDVIPFKPTVMTIMLGMNDGGYRVETKANDEKYFAGYRHIVESTRSSVPGVRITAIQPSPYDNVTRPPAPPATEEFRYNDVLVSFGKWIANYAQAQGLQVVDMNSSLVNTLVRARDVNPTGAQDIIPDHIHPAIAGHLIMAEDLLRAWGARPIVSSVSIDASGATATVTKAEFATVTNLSGPSHLPKWTETDEALPLPLSQWREIPLDGAAVGLVLEVSDFAAALNQQLLQVTGLIPGVYALEIDGETAGVFNNENLAAGINLGSLKTPMSAQAMEVYRITTKRGDIQHDRWRDVQVPLAKYTLAQKEMTVQSMNLLGEEVSRLQRRMAEPKPHSFTLVALD